MNTLDPSHARRRSIGGGAFSLIELIAVIAITAILAAAAAPAMQNLATTRAAGAAHRLVRDLGYARERAIASGTPTWVVFDAANESYSVLAEDSADPGRDSAAIITDAATGRPFTVIFGSVESSGVGIVSVSIDGGSEVGFDWLGAPMNDAEDSLAADGLVTLSSSKTITIRTMTGLASTP